MEIKCPFNKMRSCQKDCALFRKGVRYFDDPTKQPEIFEACGLSILIDAAENQIMRLLGVQQEVNVLRNTFEKGVVGLLELGKARKAIEHEVEHRVTQRLLESKEERLEIIDIDGECVSDNGPS